MLNNEVEKEYIAGEKKNQTHKFKWNNSLFPPFKGPSQTHGNFNMSCDTPKIPMFSFFIHPYTSEVLLSDLRIQVGRHIT